MAFRAKAAAVTPAEVPSPPKESDKTTTTSSEAIVPPSSNKVPQLRDEAGDTSSEGTSVFRLTFGGRTVFEYRSSSSRRPSCFPASSSSIARCRGERPPQPVVPNWVMALASRFQEEEELPRFLMEKKITTTDLDGNENRLLIPAGFVEANLMPLLSEDERKTASLDGNPKKRKRETRPSEEEVEMQPNNPELQLQLQSCKRRKTMEKGRKHGGLQVTAWSRSRWHFDSLSLTCWDRTNGTVLKGGHLKYLFDRSFLRQGDHVQLWGFRDARRQLHLAIHKPTSSSSSSHA